MDQVNWRFCFLYVKRIIQHYLLFKLMLQEALALYNRNSTLKHMISKIRRDNSSFERYQHNRDLVALVNIFADTSKDLPENWETKFDRHGKVSFSFKIFLYHYDKFLKQRLFIINSFFVKFF